MKFTDRLLEKTLPIWRQNHSHPFVQGIGDGTLDPDKFRFYMVQDYLYLIDYSKVFAIGAVKADDLETMGKFASLLDGTLNTEMALHRSYAERFGISEQELETQNLRQLYLPIRITCCMSVKTERLLKLLRHFFLAHGVIGKSAKNSMPFRVLQIIRYMGIGSACILLRNSAN